MFVGNELTVFFFLLCFLAAFRVATLFSLDLGPLHVFWHIREFLKNRSESVGEHRHDEFWRTATFKQRLWRSAWELFDCQYCFGMWAAALIVTVFPLWLIVILAVAGAQSLVHRMVRVPQSQNDVLEQALKLSRESEESKVPKIDCLFTCENCEFGFSVKCEDADNLDENLILCPERQEELGAELSNK